MSFVSAVCTGVRLSCEVAQLIKSVDQLGQATSPDDLLLRGISIGSRCVAVSMNIAGHASAYQGGSLETQLSYKEGEYMARWVGILPNAATAYGEGRRGMDLLEHAVLLPTASLSRCSYEKQVLECERYLQMSPQELARHPERIYDDDGFVVEKKPRRVEELKVTLAESQESLKNWKVAETAFVSGAVAGAVRSSVQGAQKTLSTAHQLYLALMGRPQQAQVGHPVPDEVDPLDLLAMPRIPAALHNDPHLRLHMCPITQVPIRYAIGDPNGATFYERAAIEQWIRQNGTSPVTRQRLTLADLRPAPAVQVFIDNRLRHHQERLNAVVEEVANQPVDEAL